MCRSRNRSASSGILLDSLPYNALAEVAAEIGGGPKVDGAADQLRKLTLDPCHSKKAAPDAGQELDKDVNVAVGTEILAKD